MGPRGQEPNESTDDAVWQDLVARLEGPAAGPESAASPRGSHGHAAGPPAPGEHGASDRERVDAIFHNQPRRSGGPRDYREPDEPDDDAGFTPEDPPPFGTGNPLTVLAWFGAAGGPVMLLLFAMFWRDAPAAATFGVLALFLAGAGYLLTKLPKNRNLGDDGAEV